MYDLFLKHPLISTDSRSIAAGSIFFALHGGNFDGNRFAAEALAGGAAAAVVDDPSVIAGNPSLAARMVLVDDTLAALQSLANTHRRRLGIPVIAIAGSNGKTTTKELTAAVLSRKYALHATRGNLNNHIGVPLTLLQMTPATRLGIVEMGASACGEIALLTRVAEPDFGILTNIGRSHLEGFGGIGGVRRGKGELYDWLASSGGTAFVRADDPTLAAMAAERPSMKSEYYTAAMADGIDSALAGSYNRLNIAAAAAIGRHFGVADEDIRQAIADYRPSNMRSQRVATERGNRLVVDCYNANPSSMEAAIPDFAAGADDCRRIVILGDMLELGADSAGEHVRILQLAASTGAEVWTAGGCFAAAAAEGGIPAGERIRTFRSREELERFIAGERIAGAEVLIKGSRRIGLEKIIDLL